MQYNIKVIIKYRIDSETLKFKQTGQRVVHTNNKIKQQRKHINTHVFPQEREKKN